MKRDVNLFFLGLLVLIILSMVGMGLYFQNEYKGLASEYNSALDKLEEKNAELDKKIVEINKTREELDVRERSLVDIIKELNLTKEKQNSLGGFFENLKGEKETLEENLTSTQQEVSKWKANYADKKKDLDVCQKSVELKTEQIAKKDSKINYMVLKAKEASYSLNQSEENLYFVKKDLEDLSSQIDDLYIATGDLEVPAEISADAQDDIQDDLEDLRSYIRGKLGNAITSLGNSISNGKRSITSIGSA
jgi:chromosome segregation ATPase